MKALGWRELDVILVTGDAYIDSPCSGVAVIGKVLISAGYRVGVIPQPDVSGPSDITALGEPALFWGVTAGSMDSMVANYTATKKFRKTDDMTPGGVNDRRPDRATIVYTNLIRRHFKNTAPVVLGGIEASLRRISHYDFWSDAVRRGILFDARADLLAYGMAENTILEIAEKLSNAQPITGIRGTCHIAGEVPEGFIELPSHHAVTGDASGDKAAFERMFRTFYQNNDPLTARGLCQLQDTRYLVHNPPPLPLTAAELDSVFELGYEHDAHPVHHARGPLRALDTMRFSIATHRGCYGECRFCAISVHQGRTVVSRSQASILREAESMTAHPLFKGIIQDVGGPTANMYGIECRKKLEKGACRDKRCLYPRPCRDLSVNHGAQVALLRKLRGLKGVRKIFIASGIRHDMILHDQAHGQEYLAEVASHHVSGQLKIAPEHTSDNVLSLMGKPGADRTRAFLSAFDKANRKSGKKQYLTYYFIAAHPGTTMDDMRQLRDFTRRTLKIAPEQVQVFTPTPSTFSTLMYHTCRSCDTGEPIFVEKDTKKKEKQKQAVTGHRSRPDK